MRIPVRKGVGFGLTSGIITTLGLIVGLHSGTHSKPVVMGGVLVIAIADALSDSTAMHVSEESEAAHSVREVWESAVYTFASKLLFALTFLVPILLLDLSLAILASIGWGLFLITLFSIYIARETKAKAYKVILEHMVIAVAVVLATHYIGDLIALYT
ncbi:MAG: hypothetical protein QW569_05685 [Candidatus Bathyarchaeia archaeon]|nr:hypothetical protein [Candidatus Bathyarchaeota archaeon]